MLAMPLAAALADTVYGLDYVGVAITLLVGAFPIARFLRRRLTPQPA
jgi:hypothetical protein